MSSGIDGVVVLCVLLSWATVRRNGEMSRDGDFSKDCGEPSQVIGSDMFLSSLNNLTGDSGVPLTSSPASLSRRDDRPCFSPARVYDEVGDRRPNNILGDHGDFSSFGDMERADRLLTNDRGDVFGLDRLGIGGGGRGVINLSAGTIVLTSACFIELIEPLRSRGSRTSTGTQRRLTGWPGR